MALQQHQHLLWGRTRVPRHTETSWKHGGTSKAAVAGAGQGLGLPSQVLLVPVQPPLGLSPSRGLCSSTAPEQPPPNRHGVGPGEETGQRGPDKAQLCPAGPGNRQINGL